MNNKEICKWCDHCMITDLEKGCGICYLDIGEYVKLDQNCCCEYRFNSDLDRC